MVKWPAKAGRISTLELESHIKCMVVLILDTVYMSDYFLFFSAFNIEGDSAFYVRYGSCYFLLSI